MSVVEAAPAPLSTLVAMRGLLTQAGLSAPPRRRLQVERDIPVPARDGVRLLTDHWAPVGERSGKIVLVRTPYGRHNGEASARLMARFGHDVVVQSCRGTFGSGATFTPFLNERSDGEATFDWLREQPWWTGAVHTMGASYVGFTQWAIAENPPPGLEAINVAVTSRNFRESVVYPGGGFGMETALSWLGALDVQERAWAARWVSMLSLLRGVGPAADTVPPRAAMRRLRGHDIRAYDDWLTHAAPEDPYWADVDFSRSTRRLPPVTIVAGWQDLFATEQLQDVVALQHADVRLRTVVGPWTHTDSRIGAHALRETLVGLGSLPAPTTPAATRVWIGGSRPLGWRTMQAWPPPASRQTWFLGADQTLSLQEPVVAASRRLRYDPADPAPNAGGRALNPATAGARSQRAREARDDVLVWTGPALDEPLVVVGVPTLSVSMAADGPHDLFARLCDVDERGRSHLVCDAFVRLAAPTGGAPRHVELDLGPLAHRFARGHALRLQISAAAHPLYLRHPGWAAPLGDVDRFEVRELRVVIGSGTACSVTVPIVTAT